MLILNSPDDRLLAPDSSPKGRFLIFARGLMTKIVIIGAGIVGATIALSAIKLKVEPGNCGKKV